MKPGDLSAFVVELDHDSRIASHSRSKLPSERRPRVVATADRLAEAVSLDMTAHWVPTTRTYLGRVTKPHILAAVREAVRDGCPALMRTPRAVQEPAEHPQADTVTEMNPDASSVAAE